MPKIIHNIQQRIEDNALELFSRYDFNQVDMKMIAKKCNIAVGTLYNYYPNKMQLFISVVQKSWGETSTTLDAIYFADISPFEKLYNSIEILYDDIKLRKGMGKSIYKILAKYELDDDLVDTFHTIFFKIERLFEPFEKKSLSCSPESVDIRLAKSLIVMLQNSIVSYPNHRQDNLNFVRDFFYTFLHHENPS
ncbi:MAG: TetR family transcriptional regulator [Clostridia bacterium]|jgi:AcrR family transcriptional regulator|nr:TetR family transcriptional regulator [Clostridia bacterium]